MSERLEERLRRAAQTYRRLGNHSAEGLFLEAADTITELRGALQVASVDYRHLSGENEQLMELVRKVEHYERIGCHECPYADSCDAGTLYDEDCAMSREIEHKKRELGVGA